MTSKTTSFGKILYAKTDVEHIDEIAEIFTRLSMLANMDSGPVGELAADILHAPLTQLPQYIQDSRRWDKRIRADFQKAIAYVICLGRLKHSAASNRRANSVRRACLAADSTNFNYVSQLVLYKKALEAAKWENKSSMKKIAERYVAHSPEVLALRQVFLSTTDDFLTLKSALEETNRRIQPEKRTASKDSDSPSVEKPNTQPPRSEHTDSRKQIARSKLILESLAGTEQAVKLAAVNRSAIKKDPMYTLSKAPTRSE
jgi:hypothetical protein